MKVHYAEEHFKLPDEFKKNDILKYLEEQGALKRIGDRYLLFQNFTGFFECNDTEKYLIIPKKLAKSLKLIENDGEEEGIVQKYEHLFEKFLKYILLNLSKEQLIYSLNLTSFPVDEFRLNPSKIFKVLLLLEKKEEIINSLHLIMSNMHRKLDETAIYKQVSDVSYIDSDIIIDMIVSQENLVESENGIFSYEKKKYYPALVLQYETIESFDTLENRFIKHFLRELEHILSEELKDFLFLEDIKQIKEEVTHLVNNNIFLYIGDLNYFPANSQVLLKKAGYREIFQIYRLLHLSFRPAIFRNLDMAFSLKDMANLWEYYVLIKLLQKLKDCSKQNEYKVIVNFEEKTKNNTLYEYAKFEFNNIILHYQLTKDSYSELEYRPDFYIEHKDDKEQKDDNKVKIFDAKFRIFEENRKDILENMHYYKDGLKASFAVAICLSSEEGKEEGTFWATWATDENQKNQNKKQLKFDNIQNLLYNNDTSNEGVGFLTLHLLSDLKEENNE